MVGSLKTLDCSQFDTLLEVSDHIDANTVAGQNDSMPEKIVIKRAVAKEIRAKLRQGGVNRAPVNLLYRSVPCEVVDV